MYQLMFMVGFSNDTTLIITYERSMKSILDKLIIIPSLSLVIVRYS